MGEAREWTLKNGEITERKFVDVRDVEYHVIEKTPMIEAAPEMLEIMERALKLSKEHSDFCLYAMEPFEKIIKKARGEQKGE